MAESGGASQTQTQLDRKADGSAPNAQKTASSNAKDPLRPRRKKAKRACFACQRAHLTCGAYPCFLSFLSIHTSVLALSDSATEPLLIIVRIIRR